MSSKLELFALRIHLRQMAQVCFGIECRSLYSIDCGAVELFDRGSTVMVIVFGTDVETLRSYRLAFQALSCF